MKRALLLLLTACADPGPSARSAPIINGTFDDGDPAVVALTDTSGDVVCTATLVAPRVVVAAAHCLLFGLPDYAYVGPDPAAGGGTFVPIVAGEQNPTFDFDTLTGDISVLILAQPVAAPPVALSRRAPVVGEPARFVGYGYTEVGPSGEYGRKYQVSAPITSVEPTTFGYGVATCNGDSGGPAFVVEAGGEVLAGVTSWGDGPCSSFGYDTRVDAYADWVQGYIDTYAAATCDADALCAAPCPAPDPDCPCIADGFCTAACADPATDPDCPDTCGAEGTCTVACAQRDPDCPIIPAGGLCTTDFDCGDNLCAGSLCSEPCDPAAPACAEGDFCLTVDGRDVCVEPACPNGSDCEETCACRTGRGGPGAPGGLFLLALVIALFRPKRAR